MSVPPPGVCQTWRSPAPPPPGRDCGDFCVAPDRLPPGPWAAPECIAVWGLAAFVGAGRDIGPPAWPPPPPPRAPPPPGWTPPPCAPPPPRPPPPKRWASLSPTMQIAAANNAKIAIMRDAILIVAFLSMCWSNSRSDRIGVLSYGSLDAPDFHGADVRQPLALQCPLHRAPGEIGRASCRERVEIEAGAV